MQEAFCLRFKDIQSNSKIRISPVSFTELHGTYASSGRDVCPDFPKDGPSVCVVLSSEFFDFGLDDILIRPYVVQRIGKIAIWMRKVRFGVRDGDKYPKFDISIGDKRKGRWEHIRERETP